jgi:hypothetical protein
MRGESYDSDISDLQAKMSKSNSPEEYDAYKKAIGQLREAGFNRYSQMRGVESIRPSGAAGGGMPYERHTAGGSNWGVIQDPIAQIAERLGQVRGRNTIYRHSPSASLWQDDAIEQETAPLQDLLKKYSSKQDMENDLLQEQLKRMKNPGAYQTGSGGGGGGGAAMLPGMSQGREPQMGPAYVVDPYQKVRNAAMEAAMNYLRIQSPHMVSSLDLKKRSSSM